jgi:hypothetical protein
MANPNLDRIKELLAAGGIDLSSAGKALRALNKDAAEARAAEFEARKESNKDALVDIMESTRESLADAFSDLLPGTHANFTVRVTKEGAVVSTANDCHASGYRDSIHVTPAGDVVTGEEGAEMAKNVRPRKSGDS